MIIMKSASNEGQTSFFGTVVKKYIEETSASISVGISKSPQQFADINSLTANFNSWGQGGPELNINPSTVQDSSLLANNPVSPDYLETGSFKRNQIVEYTVQSGDAVSFIASDYGVSIDTILWANNLSSVDNIKSGQILRIPPVSGVIHKVKKGDTLAALSKKYGVEEEKIVEFNSLPQNGELRVDDEIIIPDGQIKSTYIASSGSKVSASKVTRFSYLPSLGDYFFIPNYGFNWGRIHGRNGVDVANSCGTPIYAAADGNIITADSAGWNGGFGKYIKIAHPNGTETLYAHLSKILIGVGDTVTRGQLIGNMGTTGRSTGCHVHLEVHGAKNPLAKY